MGCQQSMLSSNTYGNISINKIDFTYFIKANNATVLESYTLCGWINRSNTALVRKVKHRLTGIQRVAKIYHRQSNNEKRAMNEINALKRLDHPNIIKLYEYFIDKSFIYIILQKIEGNMLYDQLLGINQSVRKNFPKIFKQILLAVQHCHSNGIVHRNITADNIIVCKDRNNNNIVKLVDFAQAFFLPHSIVNERIKLRKNNQRANNKMNKLITKKTQETVCELKNQTSYEQAMLKSENIKPYIKEKSQKQKNIQKKILNINSLKNKIVQSNINHLQPSYLKQTANSSHKSNNNTKNIKLTTKQSIQKKDNINISFQKIDNISAQKNKFPQIAISNFCSISKEDTEKINIQQSGNHNSLKLQAQPKIWQKPMKSMLKNLQAKVKRKCHKNYQTPEIPTIETIQKQDIWYCGVILFTIVSGKNLFYQGTSAEQTIQKYIKQWKKQNKQTPLLADIMEKMLNIDPYKRYDAFQSLCHPFLQQSKQRLSQWKVTIIYKFMHDFKNDQRLKQLFSMYLSKHLSSLQDQSQFMLQFCNLDTNKDGKLQYQQLVQGLMNSFCITQQNAIVYVQQIFDKLDKNKNRCIQYSQFLMGTLNISKAIQKDNLKKLFNDIDKNGDQFINEEQLKCLFEDIDDEGQFKKLINKRQKSHKGLSFQQFEKYVKQIMQQKKI